MLQKNHQQQKNYNRYQTPTKQLNNKLQNQKKKIKKNEKKNYKFIQKKYQQHTQITTNINHQQNIFICLDLAKYGFDSMIKNQSMETIQNLFKINQLFSINPNVQGIMWKQLCNEMIKKMQKQTYLLQHKKYITLFSLNNQSQQPLQEQQQYIEINHLEKTIWECMHELLARIKQGANLPGLFGIISQQIFNARKILEKSFTSLENIKKISSWKLIQKIYQKYLQQLMNKTFRYGLLLEDIDQLNYFLDKEYEENNRSKHVQIRINNWQQWANFISKKRVRLRKASKFLLHTACQLCLSPYSQQSNRIINCPQCRMRGHQLCLQTNSINRCGRCIYLRLPNQVKSKISQCFLCGVNNLLPLKITSSKFVHVFCILAHGFWKIQNGKVFIKEREEKNNCQFQTCLVCLKSTKYYTKCQKCYKTYHYLCAFMNGASFITHQNYPIKLQCCKLQQTQTKNLSYLRHYILNYDNIVFKKLGEIKKNNRSKTSKSIKNQTIKFNQQIFNEQQQQQYENSENQINNQMNSQIQINYLNHHDFDCLSQSNKSNQ